MQVKFRNGLNFNYMGDIYLNEHGKVIIELDDFSRKFFEEITWLPGYGSRKVHITPEDGALYMKALVYKFASYATITFSIEDRDNVWIAPYLKDENETTNGEAVPSEANYVYA